MNSDIRISVSFKGHRKRKKLQAILGPGSTDYLIDLWIGAAVTRPVGILHGFDALDIAMEAGWSGDPEVFKDALIKAGFLDVLQDGTYALHDWKEHQPFVIHAKTRSESAKKAAKVKWENRDASRLEPGHLGHATPLRDACDADASPMRPADDPHCGLHAEPMRPGCEAHATRIAGASDPQCGMDASRIDNRCDFDAHSPTPIPTPIPVPGIYESIVQDTPKSSCSPAVNEPDSDFETFWQDYPARGVPPRKQGKARALKVWKQLSKKRELPDLAVLLRLLETEKESRQWNDPQYIPMATTWLNSKPWQDSTPDGEERPGSGSVLLDMYYRGDLKDTPK